MEELSNHVDRRMSSMEWSRVSKAADISRIPRQETSFRNAFEFRLFFESHYDILQHFDILHCFGPNIVNVEITLITLDFI